MDGYCKNNLWSSAFYLRRKWVVSLTNWGHLCEYVWQQNNWLKAEQQKCMFHGAWNKLKPAAIMPESEGIHFSFLYKAFQKW